MTINRLENEGITTIRLKKIHELKLYSHQTIINPHNVYLLLTMLSKIHNNLVIYFGQHESILGETFKKGFDPIQTNVSV